MKKTTYRVTLPDGTVATRTTELTYTHAVAFLSYPFTNPDAETWAEAYDTSIEPTWDVCGFCGRLDLAEKTAARLRGRPGVADVKILSTV